MSKIGLIIGREYFTRVKKKSFLITTILVPVIIAAFYGIIFMIAIDGSTEKPKVALLDQGSLISDSAIINSKKASLVKVSNETEASFVKKYKTQGYEAFLYVPKIDILSEKPKGIILHSQSSLSLGTSSAIENIVNESIEEKRMIAQGIEPARYKKISSDIDIESTIDTEDGGKKTVSEVAYAVSFACGILIYMMMIIYGTQVMRGVTEEKTSRIAEVVVSSVKPFQLMMGKIIGIGAVGLTQFAIWFILLFLMQFLIPADMLTKASAASESAGAAATIATGISSLPLLKIAIAFVFFFLAGYLLYASLFAAVGSVVSEDQQEAQQLIFPILMPIILGFVIMTKAINDPHSNLAVFGSLFPLTSPIVMMGRITYDIPLWQIACSVVLLVACFFFFTWITAKIYRTGILMYGKKPSWKEMMKWAFKKA